MVDELVVLDDMQQAEPLKVYQTINGMNKKAATIPNDLPMKQIMDFSVVIAFTWLIHSIDACLKSGVYSNLFKHEPCHSCPQDIPSTDI